MKAPFKRVLVANRGEIAIRVMRTCRDLGVETVAVFSDADRLSAHVLYADRAVHIGAAPAAESYLVGERILKVCSELEVDAIHPGYGFLSENAEFAEACASAGVTFIGPPADAMRVMGSKTQAREAMYAASVPMVPGRAGADGAGLDDVKVAMSAADELGYPVLIKASAGGGGKGMRLVADSGEFERAFDAAKREAKSAFGDDTVYVEKAIVKPRHVEIQVFADSQGNTVYLGERDCSIQRRHQKVVEEAPCPVLSDELRKKMGESAVAAAKACDYVGAGTVEFLFDGREYYFLEMNTRLQVEHPVTEMIFGVDLVDWQLRIAAGEGLPMTQEELDARRHGSAIECRIYAEDPERFLPSPGTIKSLRTPSGPYVRDDSGVYEGAVVSPYYDPLLSKLITWGETRDIALRRMKRALSEYHVGGIATNLQLHRRVMEESGFASGEYDTGYLERLADKLCVPAEASGSGLEDAVMAASVVQAASQGKAVKRADPGNGAGEVSFWRRSL